jgi:hypothetical protein
MSVIEFIQYGGDIHPDFCPIPAKKLVPEWYKNLSPYVGDKRITSTAEFFIDNNINTIVPKTIKSCIPVQDYICGGYLIKATSDIFFTQEEDVNGETSWLWSSTNSNLLKCSPHNFVQFPISINDRKNTYIKLQHNIGVKTPKGYSCLFYQPEFFFEERFTLFPAIVDTDVYHNPVNFPGLITDKEKNFLIEAGTPLMIVFPFKREEWVCKLTKTKEDIQKQFVSEKWYSKFFHSTKSYD